MRVLKLRGDSGVRAFIVLSASIILPGCPSEAEMDALRGIDAFESCDLREANRRFEAAYDQDSRPDFGLAYALSAIAVLPESAEFAGLWSRLGFDSTPDTRFLWGPNGLLERLRSTESCDSLEDFVLRHIPHAAALDDSVDIAERVDPSLKVSDLYVAIQGVDSKLAKLQTALEAATQNPDGVYELRGGCG